MAGVSADPRIEILGPEVPGYAEILTAEALKFLGRLSREFGNRREELLHRRYVRQQEIDSGKMPDFLEETASIRGAEWTVAPIPQDLQDRRVEITGPVDRKMVINALNSGANVFMADFEDSNSPTWHNNIEGQINLRDAVNGTIAFTSPEGKQYELNEKIATLLVRPRGWHLVEKHLLVDGKPISGIAVRFRPVLLPQRAQPAGARAPVRISICRRWKATWKRGCGTTCSSSRRTTWAFRTARIRATVLIETILAAFEMDEILYELRDHSAGPELRPLGLHFQLHQEIPEPRRISCCRTARR